MKTRVVVMAVAMGAALMLTGCGERSQESRMDKNAKTDAVKDQKSVKKHSGVIVGNGQKYDPGSIVSGR